MEAYINGMKRCNILHRPSRSLLKWMACASDEEWKKLEVKLGMTQAQANSDGLEEQIKRHSL